MELIQQIPNQSWICIAKTVNWLQKIIELADEAIMGVQQYSIPRKTTKNNRLFVRKKIQIIYRYDCKKYHELINIRQTLISMCGNKWNTTAEVK
jgi:ribosomal protein S24E